MRKRFLSFILVLCLSMSLFGASSVLVSAASNGSCGDNITWNIDTATKTLFINGYGRMYDYSEHTNKAPWHEHLGDIYSVIISDGVSSIGNFAFHECGNINNVIIGNNVEDIGKNAFDGCSHLKTIILPNSVRNINDYAFRYCGFTDIKIPDSVTSIGQGAFEDCIHLYNIEIGNNVKVIKLKAFNNTGYVTGGNQIDGIVYIGNYLISCFTEELGENVSVKEGTLCIAEHAFDMEEVKKLETPESLKYIGKGAFQGCDLESVTLNEGLQEIGNYAFSMNDFKTINIPSSVTRIGRSAFENCRKLEEITLGSNIAIIDDCAFYYCESISDVSYQGNQAMWNKIKVGSLNYFLTNKEIKFVEKPSNEISVVLDGKSILFDQPPIIVDGRTLVPLRAIFEELGATVDWDGNTQTVTSTKGKTTISMTIGNAEMYKNGELIVLDVPPQLIGDRTLVPVRAVAEGFDCHVDWDGDTRTVIITIAKPEISEQYKKIANYASALCSAVEMQGGEEFFNQMLIHNDFVYTTLNELDNAIDFQETVLTLEGGALEISKTVLKFATGNYGGAAKEIAGALISNGSDVMFAALKECVPDMQSFIYNIGVTACEKQEDDIKNLKSLHSKLKSGEYTEGDAVSYIYLYYQVMINNENSSLSIILLHNELPQNFFESLDASLKKAAGVFMPSISGDILDLDFATEAMMTILEEYAFFVCGETNVFYEKMIENINHPAVEEWSSKIQFYTNALNERLASIK